MIEDLEGEVFDLRATIAKAGAQGFKNVEDQNTKLQAEMKELDSRYKTALEEISEKYRDTQAGY